MVRSHYQDAAATDSIVSGAFLAREAAGLLTGHAAGEASEPAGPDLLADDRAVFGLVGEQRLWHSELVARLVELRPVPYSVWDVRRLGAELRDRGRADRSAGGHRRLRGADDRRGIRLADVDTAILAGSEQADVAS